LQAKKVSNLRERISGAKKARLHCLGTHSGTEIAPSAARPRAAL
jgi:hypothetical protein